ncbi:helix-turn-helix transcriptional regulator [Candidatus Woesearchaeota archaeon]|nr:helix-turn-helix transcriptional regulator [Candidatus Woesearchaeota archaeon]
MLLNKITKVEWRLLQRLEEEPASLSALARVTGTTKANVFHALKSLEQQDLVRKNIQGRTHTYHFNPFHPSASLIVELIMEGKKEAFNKKLSNIPLLVHSFLQTTLQASYQGCIFFGSSISQDYHDIDIFIMVQDKSYQKELTKKLKFIEKKISPSYGTAKELYDGIKSQDMLYKNIASGIPYGTEAITLRHCQRMLQKQDIRERFMLGYRELLSCMEFNDKEYQKRHLDKGVMDILYAICNYFDMAPKNDVEAIKAYKAISKKGKPTRLDDALLMAKWYGKVL